MKTANDNMEMEIEYYIQLFKNLPCGAYIIKDDPDFTLLYGNSIFYELFNCTEEKIKHKYGNRFGALITSEDQNILSKFLRKETDKNQAWMRLKIFAAEAKDVWIHLGVSAFTIKGEQVLCCFCTDITSLKNTEEELYKLKNILQFILSRNKGEIIEYEYQSQNGRVVISGKLCEFLGIKEDEVIPQFVEKVVALDLLSKEAKEKFKDLFYTLGKNKESGYYDFQLDMGVMRWIRVSVFPMENVFKDADYTIGFFEDVTQEKQTFLNYLNETQYYQALLTEKVAYGHIDVTEDKIIKIGGMWNLYNEIIDKVTYTDLFENFIDKVVHPDDRQHYKDVMQCSNYIESLRNGINQVGCEFRRIVEQNKMVWMELKVHLFRSTHSNHVLALLVLEDIDDRKKYEIIQVSNAERDLLTDVYSKKMTESVIRDYIITMEEYERSAFILLDIDDFKDINEAHGYQKGDEELKRVAEILGKSFRKQDYIGRFSGDNFMLFIKDIGNEEKVIERLQVFYNFIEWDEQSSVTCSTGITMVDTRASYEEVLNEAVLALYTAKHNNRGSFVFYSNEQMVYADEAQDELCRKNKENHIKSIEVLDDVNKANAFDTFVGEHGDMAYFVNPQTYAVVLGNKAFYDRIGLTKAEIHGQKCYEFMQKRTSPCPFCSKSNWTTDKYYIWKNKSRALEQEFLMKNKYVQWKGQKVLLAIAVDISNDKSIADSMESNSSEAHSVLSGIEKMTSAPDLSDSMKIAMENIGFFFVADAVEFWHWDKRENQYINPYSWKVSEWNPILSEFSRAVNTWLQSKTIYSPIIIENRESMINYCYDMYEVMERNKIDNQRWIPLYDNDTIEGYIAIHNISANFQNVSFLDSFLLFVANERKNRSLLESILYASRHDALTGLLNRTSYDEYYQNFNCDGVNSVAIVMGDINGLKEINRLQGFRTGDDYIKGFARILKDAFQENPVFRLSGDEFLILAENVSQAEVEKKIKQIKRIVKEENRFTVSLGLAWDNIEKDLSEMVETATEIMKVNKEHYYDFAEEINNAKRHRMLQELIYDIEKRNFKVFLQPKVDFSNGKYSGAEALIRYETKKTGLVPPAKFIKTLEENNFIRYVDMFVFEETCRLLERWQSEGRECPVISVNFSRMTLLEADIIETVETTIAKYAIERDKVEIEVTESSGSIGKGVLFQTIKSLYRGGFSISLDDFGTKYTNLSILSDVDFHVLKLDRSLIDVVDKRERDRIVIKNVITMCREMGIKVIAEGIEIEEQEAILKEMGCDWGQGYLYGKPVRIEEYEKKYLK